MVGQVRARSTDADLPGLCRQRYWPVFWTVSIVRGVAPSPFFCTMVRMKTMRSPYLKEVRGRGLWIGVELTVPARAYCEKLKEEGILCKETHDKVIRIAPPLVITREQIDWALPRIRRVIES